MQYIAIIISIFVLSACSSAAINQNKPAENKQFEQMIRVNKLLVKKNVAQIKAYIARHNWQMNESQSGLWFGILKQGMGNNCASGATVAYKYRLELLDGTLCYTSDSTGTKTITIGKGQAEAGVEEALQMLNEGAKAHLILPPHLAFGMFGDQHCIPARATLVYDIEIIRISK